MKMTLIPHDKPGAWAAILAASFVIMIWLKIKGSMPLPTFAIAAIGLAGFFAGIFAIVVRKNRSLLTFMSIPIGLLILVWFTAELIFTH